MILSISNFEAFKWIGWYLINFCLFVSKCFTEINQNFSQIRAIYDIFTHTENISIYLYIYIYMYLCIYRWKIKKMEFGSRI